MRGAKMLDVYSQFVIKFKNRFAKLVMDYTNFL